MSGASDPVVGANTEWASRPGSIGGGVELYRYFQWSLSGSAHWGTQGDHSVGGERPDGVSYEDIFGRMRGILRGAGKIHQVELGGSVSAGNILTTGVAGKAVVAGTGDFEVSRALEGGSSGDLIHAVFL